MSIANIDDVLVSEKDTFDIALYYKREGVSLIVAPDYAATEVSSSEVEGAKRLVVTMRLPDWRMSKQAVRNNTMIVGGEPVLDNSSFKQALFEMMAVSWNLVDTSGDPVSLDGDSLGKIRPEIMRCLIELLERKLVEKGVYTSIINC